MPTLKTLAKATEDIMSADKHRAVRRVKQKRAKDMKRELRKQTEAAIAALPAKAAAPQKAE